MRDFKHITAVAVLALAVGGCSTSQKPAAAKPSSSPSPSPSPEPVAASPSPVNLPLQACHDAIPIMDRVSKTLSGLGGGSVDAKTGSDDLTIEAGDLTNAAMPAAPTPVSDAINAVSLDVLQIGSAEGNGTDASASVAKVNTDIPILTNACLRAAGKVVPVVPPKPAGPAPTLLTGYGQQAKHFTVTDGLTVLTAKCRCAGNFSAELLDASGQSKDVPINVIGHYAGSKGEGLTAGGYILKVDADASWSIRITQPRDVAAASLPHTYTGSGQQFVGPFSADAAVGFQARNHGSSNFAVEILNSRGESQDIPFNQIGTFSGSTVSSDMSGGPYYLNVDSDGSWTINVSAP